MVAVGAAWESRALATLAEEPDVVVLRRCVDVDDLLASATAGQADVAVVGLEAPGLDPAAVQHLGRYGVRTIAVVTAAQGVVPEQARVHASRLGVPDLVTDADLDDLAAVVTAADVRMLLGVTSA